MKKNPQKNASKNHKKYPGHKGSATAPAKATIPTDKGSDLLLLCSNKSSVAGGQPARTPIHLHEGQVVYLREMRRRS